MRKIKRKLEKAGDFLLFWCVISPILWVMWRFWFKELDKKIDD